jgi:hypothetical protein
MKKFAPKPAPRGARPTGTRPAGARTTGARPAGSRPPARTPGARSAAGSATPRPARTTRDAPPRKSYGRDDERAPRKSFARDDERAPRKAFSRDDERTPRAPRKSFGSSEGFGDPYKRAARPPREAGERAERGERGERFSRGSGFTVTLDPDVARVFRGDASVNKALRLVMQLVQVVEGPGPRSDRGAPPRSAGYQGSAEARGFERKPRFMEDEDDDAANASAANEDIEGEE